MNLRLKMETETKSSYKGERKIKEKIYRKRVQKKKKFVTGFRIITYVSDSCFWHTE